MDSPLRARRPRVTLDQLHTFVAVARHEHVTRAAVSLHLTQGAVSQQLRLLERALGVSLFERRGRGLRLTPEGRHVERSAVVALESARAVEESAEALRGLETGTIAVAASNVMGIHRLPWWLADFLARHPRIELTLRLENTAGALARLDEGAVDCAVVGGAVPPRAYESLILERDEVVLVVAAEHPLAGVPVLTPDILRRHRYLARERGSGTETIAPRLVGAAYRAGPVLELSQVDAVRAGVLAGLGFAALPRAVIRDDIAAGRLCVLPRRGRPVLQTFRALRRLTAHAPALEALWDHFRGMASAAGDDTPQLQTKPAGRRRAPR